MTAERRRDLLILANEDANADAPDYYRPSMAWIRGRTSEESAYYAVWYEVCHTIARDADDTRRARKNGVAACGITDTRIDTPAGVCGGNWRHGCCGG